MKALYIINQKLRWSAGLNIHKSFQFYFFFGDFNMEFAHNNMCSKSKAKGKILNRSRVNADLFKKLEVGLARCRGGVSIID